MDPWIAQLKKEYKTDPLPDIVNDVEGITYSFSDQSLTIPTWKSKFLHTGRTVPFSFHPISDAKQGHAILMHDLNHGCEGVLLTWDKTPNLDTLFEGIHFEHLQTVVSLRKEVDITAPLAWMNVNKPGRFSLETELESVPESHPQPAYLISGFNAYSGGCNAAQELAYLAFRLDQFLMKNSPRPISIELGIGENTVVELSKFIAIDWLIQALLEKHQHFPEIKLRCKSGWRNKSSVQANDNQIRQTMEAICGIISGVHELCITPYDFAYSTKEDLFVRRMALNTFHILENEAQLNLENFSFEKSPIIQHHAQFLCNKVWSMTQNVSEASFESNLLSEMAQTHQIRSSKRVQTQLNAQSGEQEFRELPGIFGKKAIYFQNFIP